VLADIEKGVNELRSVGDAMGAALDAQGVLAVAIEDKVADASTNIKRSNKRMTGLVAQVCVGGWGRESEGLLVRSKKSIVHSPPHHTSSCAHPAIFAWTSRCCAFCWRWCCTSTKWWPRNELLEKSL
jgi:hypothetical protein